MFRTVTTGICSQVLSLARHACAHALHDMHVLTPRNTVRAIINESTLNLNNQFLFQVYSQTLSTVLSFTQEMFRTVNKSIYSQVLSLARGMHALAPPPETPSEPSHPLPAPLPAFLGGKRTSAANAAAANESAAAAQAQAVRASSGADNATKSSWFSGDSAAAAAGAFQA